MTRMNPCNQVSPSDGEDRYALLRLKCGRSDAWRVALVRHGVVYQRVFTDTRYGGEGAALAAARAWRDEKVLTVRPKSMAEYVSVVRAHNTSGYPGVFLQRHVRTKLNGEQSVTWAWEARTPEGMKPARKKSYAFLRYGAERAFELAVQARKQFVDQMEGHLLPRVPEHLVMQIDQDQWPSAKTYPTR